jgi:AcrR family transcriptional regulator
MVRLNFRPQTDDKSGTCARPSVGAFAARSGFRTIGVVLEEPMGKGEATRERILEIAEAAVLAKGFAATSIDEVIAEAGLTKSGFFYHFRDKNALAREMLRRYVETNDRLFDDIFRRGRELSDDPLQSFLISLKLLAETMADLPTGHPGCLIASICYQERLFDREVRELTAQSVRSWNAHFRAILDGIAAVYPPREAIDLDDLAEMISCVVDGAIIMSKTLNDPKRLERQILLFRSCVKLVFASTPTRPAIGS